MDELTKTLNYCFTRVSRKQDSRHPKFLSTKTGSKMSTAFFQESEYARTGSQIESQKKKAMFSVRSAYMWTESEMCVKPP